MVKNTNLKNFQNRDFFVKNVLAHYHFWSNESRWHTNKNGKNDNALMLFLNCKNHYYIDNQLVAVANPGDIAYLPKGIVYECKFETSNLAEDLELSSDSISNFYFNGDLMDCNNNVYNAIYVSFDIFDSDFKEITLSNKIQIIKISDQKKILSHFQRIVSTYRKGSFTNLSINSALYRLLNSISIEIQSQNTHSKYSPKLNPAFQYIAENDISKITVSDLCEICGMSPSGFRKLFKENVGMSPIKYINDIKIEKAKSLLETNDISITDIASNLGFSDLGYFSKFFKERTGYAPSRHLDDY